MKMKTKHIIIFSVLWLTIACTSTGSSQTHGLINSQIYMDTFKTKSGKEVKFTPIKHASMEISFGNVKIQVDPVIDATPPHTDYTLFSKADYILITHEHYDHLDIEAVKTLSKENTVIVTNKNSADQLGKGKIMANGDTLQLADDIWMEAVPAYNTTPAHMQFHPKGRDNGFILVLDGLRIYIAGDTEDIDEMADVKDIDVAFLPCNQPYTMTPQQLRRAADIVKPRVLFPYHYGDTDTTAIIQSLERTGIDVRIRNFE